MAHVDPHADEEEEVGTDEGVVEVVEDFGGGEEEVAYVVGGVDGDAHVGEVKAVAEADESQADNVMAHELLEILAGLFQAKDEHDGLLRPVGGLEEVVELDGGLVRAMGEILVHAARVEVPHRRLGHDVHARWAQKEEVDCRVGLLHKPSLLAAFEASLLGPGPQHLLHDELAREGEDDGVEGHKGHVPGSLAILDGLIGILDGETVREEDEFVEGVRFRRIEGVAGQADGEDGQRKHPCVFDAGLTHARCEASCAAAF